MEFTGNFSWKNWSASSSVRWPPCRPQDQSTHGLSGFETRARKWKTLSVQPCDSRYGTIVRAQLRCRTMPASAVPPPAKIEA